MHEFQRKAGFTLTETLVGALATAIIFVALFTGLSFLMKAYNNTNDTCGTEYDTGRAVTLLERCARTSNTISVEKNISLNSLKANVATFNLLRDDDKSSSSVVKIYRYLSGDTNIYVQYGNNTPVVLVTKSDSLDFSYSSGRFNYTFTMASGLLTNGGATRQTYSGGAYCRNLNTNEKPSSEITWGNIPYSGEFVFDRTSRTITGYKGSGTKLVIPKTIGGIAVEAIAKNTFASKGLVSITLPESLKSVGDGAFCNNKLVSVKVPNSVNYIGISAFAKNNIVTVTLGSGITDIEHDAFAQNGVTGITHPASILFSTGNSLVPSGVFVGNNWNGVA